MMYFFTSSRGLTTRTAVVLNSKTDQEPMILRFDCVCDEVTGRAKLHALENQSDPLPRYRLSQYEIPKDRASLAGTHEMSDIAMVFAAHKLGRRPHYQIGPITKAHEGILTQRDCDRLLDFMTRAMKGYELPRMVKPNEMRAGLNPRCFF